MTRPEGLLLDLSGVLYQGDAVIEGAVEAVARVRHEGLPVRFVTNTTRSPRAAVLAKLARLGFEVAPDELFSAPDAAKAYCRAHGLSPYLLVHPALEPEFADLRTDKPNAVLIGDAGSAFDYEALNRAFRYLMKGLPLISMGSNRYFRESDGLSLDAGPFVTALEYAAEVKAVVVGKPAASFFEAAVESLGAPAAGIVMIGDDYRFDVEAAMRAGLRGVLVRTGKYREGDCERIEVPGAVCVADISAAIERLSG